jgi:protein SCO1/2
VTSRLTRNILWSLALLLAAALIWLALSPRGANPSSPHDIPALAAPPTGGDFTLAQGPKGVFHLSDLKGQVVLLYFGYTTCPDVCPTSLGWMSQMLHGLSPEEQKQVSAVFLSVDPQRDTPARLAEYVAFFHPRIIGVTGTEDELKKAGALYGAAWRRMEGGTELGYLVDHSAFIYLIDRDGKLVETIPHGTDAPTMARLVRAQLAR